ncbi:MAG: hypothetical protein GY869_30995, partial [Planctomycetes bacterium]|nr:hypothetical protein [Planctomycetota bacterium]
LKAKPLWFAKTTAAGPNNVVLFDVDGVNVILGASVNNSNTGETELSQTVPGTAFFMQSGISANDEAAGSMSISGSTVSAGDTNLIDMMLTRHGEKAGDSFVDDVYILGIMVQWVTNFNNLAVWPLT